MVHLEPKLGGRLFETFRTDAGEQLKQTGRIVLWQPPLLFVLEWRAVKFAKDDVWWGSLLSALRERSARD